MCKVQFEELIFPITPESGDSPKIGFELVLNWSGNFEKLVRGEPPPNRIEKKLQKKTIQIAFSQIFLLFRNYFSIRFGGSSPRTNFSEFPDQVKTNSKPIFGPSPDSGVIGRKKSQPQLLFFLPTSGKDRYRALAP